VNAEVKVTQPSLVLLCRKVSTMLLSQDGAAVGDTENRPDRQCTLWIPLLDGSLFLWGIPTSVFPVVCAPAWLYAACSDVLHKTGQTKCVKVDQTSSLNAHAA
jgi:hypothetical protein